MIRQKQPWRGPCHTAGSVQLLRSGPDRVRATFVDALAQILTWLEVRHVLTGQCNRFARLGIATHPRWTVVQREAAESTNLYPVAARKPAAHDLKNVLDGQFHVFCRQMFLLVCDYIYQFGLRHTSLPLAAHPAGQGLAGTLNQPQI